MSLRDMVLLAMLAALTFGMKVVMAPLPNIEPVSLMVMLLMVTFGWRGLLGVYVYVGLEILYYGLGIWNVYYLYVWAVLALLALALKKIDSPWIWALLSGLFGLFFGALCVLSDVPVGGIAFAVTKWINGIPFDLAHCAGNFVIALLLFRPLRRLMQKLYQKT